VSIVTEPDDLIGFLFGTAFAAGLAAAEAARDDAPDHDATPPAPPSMADWIEAEARAIRSKGSELAWRLAERVDEVARECRFLRAETPDQFDARSEVMMGVPSPGGLAS